MFNFFRPSKKVTFSKLLLNELYRYALSLCQQSDQAYDLVQSSCEKVLKQKIEQDSLKAYMMTCIRNEYFDQFRHFKLSLVVDEKLQNEQSVNEEVVLQHLDSIMIDKQHVAIILEQLSIDERELLYLWAVEGFSMQEIATQTNTARGTLLSRISRLKKRLQNDFPHLVKEVS
ncbi:MAG: RNA polymerase sigma factor [Psychromonas sp.]|nr:RNA polymerase sigma factor [Alteromonadales bacterium]MCP5078032.1 RNA polymerase sigma factor [Psychromonas sp.]